MAAPRGARDEDGPRRTRLRADERRAQLVAAASTHFARTSYRGATMADLAGAAGVTAALAYRHFPSKAELFAACIDHEWSLLRARWDAALAGELPPELLLLALANAFVDAGEGVSNLTALWFQAITEAHAEPALQAAFQRTLAEVHAYLEDVNARAAEGVGGEALDRVPRVEAWTFLGIGMLVAADMRLGQQVLADVPTINHERMRWLYGAGRVDPYFT